MTQTKQIHQALKRGEKLTPLDALKRFGCGRLAARCWDLRREGVPVKSKLTEIRGKRVGLYWLEKKAA